MYARARQRDVYGATGKRLRVSVWFPRGLWKRRFVRPQANATDGGATFALSIDTVELVNDTVDDAAYEFPVVLSTRRMPVSRTLSDRQNATR